MRLHHLRVTAFGPFADTVEVDFDAVGLAGLFLIQGPTGAGKTSLLDAICFALYAGVPGARPGGRALRSDHAARDVVPSVTVDFTTGPRRFRLTRSPEFLRPKRRGDGETRTPATVVLEERLGGRWVPRSTRADEVGEIVTEVLGMGLEQFSKVVLLPQGEFAAFLRATADERRSLLERLFDISTYTGVEAWLVEQRRLRAAEVAESRALLKTDLARLEDILAAVEPDVLGTVPRWEAIDFDVLPSALHAVGLRLGTHAGEALAALDAAEAACSAAERARSEAAATADRQRRGMTARAELAALHRDAQAHRRQAELLDAAARADAVSGDLRALARVAARAEAVASDLTTARARLAQFGVADWDGATVRGWVRSVTEHGLQLDGAVRAARDLTEARRRSTALTAQLETARTAHEEQLALRRAAQAGWTRARAALDKAQAARGDVERAQREVSRLQELQRQWLELDRARAEARRIADLVRVARDVEQDARDAHQRLQQGRLDGMAAELARTLVGGEACVVCGSTEHPRPASGGVSVTAEDVASAERHWQQRRALTMSHVRDLVAQQQVVATRTADLARASAGGADAADAPVSAANGDHSRASPLDGAQLAGLLAAAVARRAVAQEQAARLAVATTAVERAEQEHERLVAEVDAIALRVAALEATVAEARVREATLGKELSELLAGHAASCPCTADGVVAGPARQRDRSAPVSDDHAARVDADVSSIGEAQAGHVGVLRDAERLLTLLSAQADLAEEFAVSTRAAREALSANGFHSAEDVNAAALPADAIRELRRSVKSVDDRQAAAAAVLADEHVVAALAREPVDVALFDDAAAEARARLRAAQQAQTRAETSTRTFGQLAVALAGRARSLGPAVAAADQLSDLADTVAGLGGNNSLRMRLSSFVLAARLEKVAVLANERLAVMGEGRYQLQHSDSLAGGGRRSGLGLVVRDLWTGQVRDTSSLSGGESFMASLALALGLADAVREEAGGFDLRTLFIDEGFGTLDDESLEQVLSVLDGLREGGRAVGVVSHVSDLRTRIPVQISVAKRATGSSVHLVGVGSPAA
jgi:exonuclease SbcC